MRPPIRSCIAHQRALSIQPIKATLRRFTVLVSPDPAASQSQDTPPAGKREQPTEQVTGQSFTLRTYPRPKVEPSSNSLVRFVRIKPTAMNADVIDEKQKLRRMRNQIRSEGKTVGLVPTMGALHEGHISLMRHAAQYNDHVFVSIYVNPTQFGPNEDLSTYPQTWEADENKIRQLNGELYRSQARGRVTTIFKPPTDLMYPGSNHGLLPQSLSYVTVDPTLTGVLEGAARPNFFRGVTTVCMKLFNLVRPNDVYFGQKDIQQVSVIRRMVRDFHMGFFVHVVPTVRDRNGLALSSRNIYLGERRRTVARVLNRALSAGELAYRSNQARSRKEIVDPILNVAAAIQNEQRVLPPRLRARFEVDYISLTYLSDMQEIQMIDTNQTAVISVAVTMLPIEEPQEGEELGLGDDRKPVRLLDNVILGRLYTSLKNIDKGDVTGEEYSEYEDAEKSE